MPKGRVKLFDDAKGVGIIESDDGTDVFVQRGRILSKVESLAKGDEVTFDIVKSTRGHRALRVRKV